MRLTANFDTIFSLFYVMMIPVSPFNAMFIITKITIMSALTTITNTNTIDLERRPRISKIGYSRIPLDGILI